MKFLERDEKKLCPVLETLFDGHRGHGELVAAFEEEDGGGSLGPSVLGARPSYRSQTV